MQPSGVPWLGHIPAHWDVTRLKWHLERNDGGVWGDDPVGVGDTLVLRSTEQTVDGRWRIDDPDYRHLDERERSLALLKEGDLLITKSSGSARHIGKTTLVDHEVESLACCYSNFMQRLRLQPSASPKLMWYILNSAVAREHFGLLSNSTTGLANLNATIIGELRITMPSASDQAAIVSFLDRETTKIDSLIEDQQRLVMLLTEKRQAVISHLVTKGLNPDAPMKDSGVEWLGEVPAHWDVERLSTVALFEYGKAHEPFIHEDGEHIFASARFVSTSGEAVKLCSVNLTPARPNDILMVMSDLPNGRALARAFLVEDGCSYAVNQRVCIIRPQKASPRFLYYQLDRNEGLLRYDDGSNQTHLPNRAFTKLMLCIPPLDEQREIARRLKHQLSVFTGLMSEARRGIALLQERRSALISAAITGKVDVRGLVEEQAQAV
jgi:type I restriction enzyme S subunit